MNEASYNTNLIKKNEKQYSNTYNNDSEEDSSESNQSEHLTPKNNNYLNPCTAVPGYNLNQNQNHSLETKIYDRSSIITNEKSYKCLLTNTINKTIPKTIDNPLSLTNELSKNKNINQ